MASQVIERNAVIPAKKTDEFTTVQDAQTTVKIKVYEGERSIARHNHLLGEFDLTGQCTEHDHIQCYELSDVMIPMGVRGSLQQDSLDH